MARHQARQPSSHPPWSPTRVLLLLSAALASLATWRIIGDTQPVEADVRRGYAGASASDRSRSPAAGTGARRQQPEHRFLIFFR